MKEIDLWTFAHEKLKNNIPFILLVVADSHKSSPGRAGFKMILSDDGETIGTIGGGIMEHALLEEARSYLTRKEKICYTKKLSHNKNASGDKSGLICGGTQTMIIKSFDTNETELVGGILENFLNLEQGLLVLNPSGISFLPSKINTDEISFSFTSDNEWQYEENSGFPNTVYVIGGGHVGLAVSRVMSTLDFYVVTIDPRKDVFTMLRNTFADKKINVAYNEVSNHIKEGQRTFIVIVTSEHDSDMTALKTVITKNVKYIGLMGSKVKIKSIFDGLMQQGIASSLLKKVHAPIGIEIEAESPEEIAVSIAAEIIQVKNSIEKI